MEPEYIGDGVYAEFDGFRIELTTPNQDDYNSIFLEQEVYLALVEFVKRNTDW